jgi:hypothetical protein
MKSLSISAIIVAAVLVAFGTGLIGQRTDSNKADGSVTNASLSSGEKIKGSCCGGCSSETQVATDVTEKSSCCSSSEQVLVSTGEEKKECSGGSCCQEKAAPVLTSTEATEKKECSGGSCCQEKAAPVLTSTEATEKKECSGGSCCQEKAAPVLTSTEATEKACDGKDCKPNGECCEARKAATVLTSTEAVDDKKCEAGKCEEGKCADGTCPSQCPVTAAMAKLPKMTYAVGTEKTCCSEQAKALAEQHKAPIQYVVADKAFECPTAAMTALVEETETFVAAFVSPKKCEASGNTVIAGNAVACPVQAEKETVLVSTAVEAIKMEFEVAGEKANCSSCAASMAKEKSAQVEYVVGEQKTTCQLSARLNLAHAKYKAAVQALAAQAATPAAAATTETNAG